MLNLDTHILIDLLRGEITKKEKRLLEDHPWCISTIVLWEMAKLNQLGRIEIDFKNRELTAFLRRLKKMPISLEISEVSTQLDFKSDPADELIAATSVVHSIPLLTRDRIIRRSKMVPFA